MKVYILLMIMLISHLALADELKVELHPQKPVMGEVFQAHFRVFTESNDDPSVNFSPSGLEVVGKSNQGVSTRTVYANGKLTVTREVMIVYELVANRTGTAYMRDITVQIGGKSLRHPTISLSVLKEPEAIAEVFVQADVPKKELFVGEGIIVRYYLYSKFTLNNLDIKKYPKLNNFLKRFLQEPDRTERVSSNGQIYLRSQIYAAKLFPEKIGQLKIDPISLSATFPVTRPGDPFGAFGLSRDYKTRTFTSESVTIEVKPLPAPVPAHFTGLIGKHDFNLEFGASRLIVNEPLEVKLTVSGSGALENLEAPSFIKHPGLEEFESNGDLKINDADMATKVFDYTFLAKSNFTLPASNITLSYFDPDTLRYVPVTLNVPEIVVAGGSKTKSIEDENSKEQTPQGSDAKTLNSINSLKLSKPSFDLTVPSSLFFEHLNSFLTVVAILLILGFSLGLKKSSLFSKSVYIPKEFKSGQFSFGSMARWMTPLIKQTGKSPIALIRESDLARPTKDYFIKLLEMEEKNKYSSQTNDLSFKYQAEHFKNLAKYIESGKNENSQQPA